MPGTGSAGPCCSETASRHQHSHCTRGTDAGSLYNPGFFLTPAAEKNKTQGQNSSKKLKEKTQPLGATLLQFVKTQEKNSSFSKISRGTPKYAIFITKYFQKREHFGNFFKKN